MYLKQQNELTKRNHSKLNFNRINILNSCVNCKKYLQRINWFLAYPACPLVWYCAAYSVKRKRKNKGKNCDIILHNIYRSLSKTIQ